MTAKDSFSIDIALSHPSYTPEHISHALSIKPRASHKAGHEISNLRKSWTHFCATLQKGDSAVDYENALSSAVLFIEKTLRSGVISYVGMAKWKSFLTTRS